MHESVVSNTIHQSWILIIHYGPKQPRIQTEVMGHSLVRLLASLTPLTLFKTTTTTTTTTNDNKKDNKKKEYENIFSTLANGNKHKEA